MQKFSRTLLIGIFLVPVCFPAIGQSGPSSFFAGNDGVRLELAPRTQLQHIDTPELILNAASRQAIAVTDASDFEQGFTTQVVRTLPALWQMTVSTQVDPVALHVDYELTSAGGRLNRLSAAEDSDSEIDVHLDPVNPKIVFQTREFTVVEGGAVFHMELSDAYLAGSYQGLLRVTVHGL